LKFPPEHLREEIAKISNERLEICTKNSGGEGSVITILSYCTSCGCNLKAKTACLSCECPLGKWVAVLNKTQESILNQELNESNSSQS